MKPMMTTLIASTSVLLVGAAGLYVWDRMPEVDADPANAPVSLTSRATGQPTPLTTDVVNPAGIAYMPDSQTYLISTDNRVFSEVSADFSTVLFEMNVARTPIKIGDTEGVTYLGDGRAAVIAENGVVILMARDGAGWVETDRFEIPGFDAQTQLGSATYDPATDTLFTAQKKGGKQLYRIDLVARTADVVPMRLRPGLTERDGRSWEEFTIAGLQIHDGRLYAISEAFSALLVFGPDGVVHDIVALDGINESSGITVRDGQLTLLGDAESYLPDPPVYLLDLQI